MIDFVPPGDTHPTGVDFRLVSGSQDVALGGATATKYGGLRVGCDALRIGTYRIQTIVHDTRGTTRSTPVTVVVDNP